MSGDAKQNDTAGVIDLLPDVNLPGLRRLREVVSRYGGRMLPGRKGLYKNTVSGLTVAVASVPEGMAGGVLAGVNPIYGLYANIIGPLAGTFLSSTQLMVIQNTSAVSLVAGRSLAGTSGAEREGAMFLVVVLAGLIAAAAGFLRLGRLTRFVSHSVMTGFLAGVAAVLILSQLPTIAGYEVEGANRIAQTLDLFRKLQNVQVDSLIVGVLTLGVALALQRTRLGHFASLVAIAVPSVLVAALQLQGVEIVRDLGAIPRGLPNAQWPSFAQMFNVLTGAAAVALVLLVQGAGVSQSVPNPDGSARKASRDFVAQGVANIASGIFRGLPVGGSVSTTALNLMAGATHRWAAISSGLWLALLVILAPGAVAHVAMPALGAVIILAGAHSINRNDIITVWHAGWPARVAAVTTFSGMLLLPIQLAVGIGVAVSAVLYVAEASSDVSIVELHELPDGKIEERQPPRELRSNNVTVLDVYGHLFFAGARTLERLLPSVRGAGHPVVILRLRGRRMLGATLVEVLARYSTKLREVNGRLYLTGLTESANDEVSRLRKVSLNGPVRVFEASRIRGESTHAAYADAEAWLVRHDEEASAEPRQS